MTSKLGISLLASVIGLGITMKAAAEYPWNDPGYVQQVRVETLREARRMAQERKPVDSCPDCELPRVSPAGSTRGVTCWDNVSLRN